MRARRGGSFVEQAEVMINGGLGSASPGIEVFSFGFRVASAIPEPGCGTICASVMIVTMLARRRGAHAGGEFTLFQPVPARVGNP